MSCSPCRVTRFVVKPCDPEPRGFDDRGRAEKAALTAANRFGASRLYRVDGEVVTDLWRMPKLLACYKGRRPR